MQPKSTLIATMLVLFTVLVGGTAIGQPLHLILPDQTSDDYQPYPLRQTPFYTEVNLLLNPVYVFQVRSAFRLNGHRLDIPRAYRPRFYSTQPFQKAFSSIGEIQDQANYAFGSVYLTFLENSSIPFFHHIRFVFGALHEKLEGDSSQVVDYRYYDGGTEATFMLEKNISYRLSTRTYQTTGIIFNITAQAGFFESVAKVRTAIHYRGYDIESMNLNRWQWPSPHNGAGWIGGLGMEVGGLVCHDFLFSPGFSRNCWFGRGLFWFFRRFAVSIASKVLVDGLNSADGVMYNGVPNNRLRITNYSMFLCGPLINFRWMNLN